MLLDSANSEHVQGVSNYRRRDILMRSANCRPQCWSPSPRMLFPRSVSDGVFYWRELRDVKHDLAESNRHDADASDNY